MLSLSADAITAIRRNAPTHIRIQFAGNSTIFDDNDVAYSGGVEIEQILNPDNDLTIGKAVSSELRLNLLNTSRLNGLDWSQPVTIRFGVEVNGSVEYCKLGVFNGSKPQKTELVDVIQFVANDNMCKFDVEASTFLNGLNWSGGITVSSLLSRICSYVGVSLATLNSSYILSNIMSRRYTSNPIGGNGYTCRDVVAWIAEANCCYARINPDGALELVWFNSGTYSSETISRNDWFSLNASEEDCEIDALKVYMSEDDIGVVMPSTATVTTKNLYRIFDNPFLSTANSSEETAYITPIYSRLTGFAAYTPVSVTADGHWYLEAGDIIQVETSAENYVRMPIFVKTLSWNGSAKESYQTTGNGERETLTEGTRMSLNYNGRIHEIKKTVDENYELIQDQFGNYYTKSETSTAITTIISSQMGNYYTKTETDSKVTSTIGTALGDYSTTTQMNNAISLAVGTKYGIVSGITINTSGVTITGSKYVSLESSGYVKVGNWYFHGTYGLCFGSTSSATVQINWWPSDSDFMISSQGTITLEAGNESIGDFVFEQDGNYAYLTAPNGLLSIGKTSRHADQMDVDYLRVYTSFWNGSSREVKDDITPLGEQGDMLDKLTPVSFVYNYDPERRTKFGLIYEDTIGILPEICSPADSKMPKGIDYINVIPLLLREIQSLRKRVAVLENA